MPRVGKSMDRKRNLRQMRDREDSAPPGAPGSSRCIRDDSTECFCKRCESEQADWERLQGWDE